MTKGFSHDDDAPCRHIKATRRFVSSLLARYYNVTKPHPIFDRNISLKPMSGVQSPRRHSNCHWDKGIFSVSGHRISRSKIHQCNYSIIWDERCHAINCTFLESLFRLFSGASFRLMAATTWICVCCRPINCRFILPTHISHHKAD